MFESDSNTNRTETLQGKVLEKEIAEKTEEFDVKFEEKFQLKKKGYSPEKIELAQAAMSNMLGEGFFSILVKSKLSAYTQSSACLVIKCVVGLYRITELYLTSIMVICLEDILLLTQHTCLYIVDSTHMSIYS